MYAGYSHKFTLEIPCIFPDFSLSKYTFTICYMSINDILHPYGLVGPTPSNVACVAGHKRNDLVNQNMFVNDVLFNSIINLLKNATNLQHSNNKF